MTGSQVIQENIIPYRPKLTAITGSVTANLLLQQIIYWQGKMGHAFYKYRTPCDNSQPGESWCESMGFSPGEFDGAKKRICTTLKKGTSHKDAMKLNDIPCCNPGESVEDYIERLRQLGIMKRLVFDWKVRNRNRTFYMYNKPLFDFVFELSYMDSTFWDQQFCNRLMRKFGIGKNTETTTETTKEKDFSAKSAEGSDSSMVGFDAIFATCELCNETYNNTPAYKLAHYVASHPDELPATAGLEVCNGCANLNGGQCSYYDFDTTTQPYFGQKCGGYKAAQKVIVRHEGGSEVGFTPQEQAIMDDSGKELRRQLGVVDWLPMHDHDPLIVICPDCTEVKHDGTCLCEDITVTLTADDDLAPETQEALGAMISAAIEELKKPDPFADKNDPANPPTPLIPADKLPEINGTRFSFGANGTIEKSPITTDDKPKRLVIREQDEPIAQTPANLKAETVETSQVMPEAAPKKAAKKAKTEKQIAHEEMQQAIIWALGIEQKDVIKWGPINTASKDLRTAKIHPDKLMGWRTWNTSKQYGIIKNAGGIPGSWPEYMKWREGQKRSWRTWAETKAASLAEKEAALAPETDPSEYITPEVHAATLELMRVTALKMSSGIIPQRKDTPNNG